MVLLNQSVLTKMAKFLIILAFATLVLAEKPEKQAQKNIQSEHEQKQDKQQQLSDSDQSSASGNVVPNVADVAAIGYSGYAVNGALVGSGYPDGTAEMYNTLRGLAALHGYYPAPNGVGIVNGYGLVNFGGYGGYPAPAVAYNGGVISYPPPLAVAPAPAYTYSPYPLASAPVASKLPVTGSSYLSPADGSLEPRVAPATGLSYLSPELVKPAVAVTSKGYFPVYASALPPLAPGGYNVLSTGYSGGPAVGIKSAPVVRAAYGTPIPAFKAGVAFTGGYS